MTKKSSYDRAAILRSAWTAARAAAAAAGQGVRQHIGAAMKAAWGAAKTAAAQPVQDCTASPDKYRIVKRWNDEAGQARVEVFPFEFAKQHNAMAALYALGHGGFLSGGGLQDFYGPADRDRDAVITVIPPAATAPAMVPQRAQLQQANAGAVLREPEVAPVELVRHTVEISAVANDFNSRMRGGTYYQILFLPDGKGGFLPGVRADQADGAVILSRAAYVDKHASYAKAWERNSETRVRISLPVGTLRKSTRGWVKRLNADGTWSELPLVGNMRKGDGWATLVEIDGVEVELT
ncbi:hypothetical protein [Methylobacterium ajmalii]|jgi:hypothetical protein|uniref:hypothetical protein n=1 Tax=Methylobacterium ajmalii TaxID=2738439 RepID=UPI00190A0256|nr:hypothetical protein [Methylobacterium ajmalii]MBK3397763.1 hypothetical protein [Methylobacterium ajmalii]MBK3408466.1 hypothetical protein [Methylobacterium ajmalii]MBK3424133.1 hypothetical protein [Methylobacterium ajmalii]MBZ6416610.1 hypothetical protein [Methylobacterium sp.]